MNIFNLSESVILIVGFWMLLLLTTFVWTRYRNSLENFLVANREIGLVIGALSSAAAWIWAPALFVSSQKAYEQGLPGIFWFTFPNALSLVLFALLAKRVRTIMSKGYTLPEFIHHRLGVRSHIVHIIAIFVAQTYAVIVQLTGSLLLLNLLTGISKYLLVGLVAAIFLSLAVLRGIRSSLMADVIKAGMISTVIFIVVPLLVVKAGGWNTVTSGFAGISGKFGNILDPNVAWTFGVPISVSLLAGVTIDQQQWQRAFSIQKKSVRGAFVLGGVLFALVPISLSLLGFVAASPAIEIQVDNTQLSGVAAVVQLLPFSAVLLFTLMILAGLASAGSAALNAVGSIGSIDIYRQYINKDANDAQSIWASRAVMIVILLIAMGIALISNVQILYIQLLVGSFRAALLIPTILALFWARLSGKAAFWGMVTGMIIGVPLFVYGSIVSNPTISSFGSLVPIMISTLVAVVGSYLTNEDFSYSVPGVSTVEH